MKPLVAGDLVQLTDQRRRQHTITLRPGATYHTHRGALTHDEIIGTDEGSVITSADGSPYLVLRPILEDYVLSMGRRAAIIYPKDAAAIVGLLGIRSGDHVVEAGAGSGALSCYLLSTLGPTGQLDSYEVRPEFAEVAKENVTTWFGETPPGWSLHTQDLRESQTSGADGIVLDMLAPWDCLEVAQRVLRPGGRLVAYVATTTQLSRTVESLRVAGCWTEPRSTESLLRTWHTEGLAVRPNHQMNGHTAFLIVSRRLADGQQLPAKKRRPAPGAYGPDYHGPRPPDVQDPTLGQNPPDHLSEVSHPSE